MNTEQTASAVKQLLTDPVIFEDPHYYLFSVHALKQAWSPSQEYCETRARLRKWIYELVRLGVMTYSHTSNRFYVKISTFHRFTASDPFTQKDVLLIGRIQTIPKPSVRHPDTSDAPSHPFQPTTPDKEEVSPKTSAIKPAPANDERGFDTTSQKALTAAIEGVIERLTYIRHKMGRPHNGDAMSLALGGAGNFVGQFRILGKQLRTLQHDLHKTSGLKVVERLYHILVNVHSTASNAAKYLKQAHSLHNAHPSLAALMFLCAATIALVFGKDGWLQDGNVTSQDIADASGMNFYTPYVNDDMWQARRALITRHVMQYLFEQYRCKRICDQNVVCALVALHAVSACTVQRRVPTLLGTLKRVHGVFSSAGEDSPWLLKSAATYIADAVQHISGKRRPVLSDTAADLASTAKAQNIPSTTPFDADSQRAIMALLAFLSVMVGDVIKRCDIAPLDSDGPQSLPELEEDCRAIHMLRDQIHVISPSDAFMSLQRLLRNLDQNLRALYNGIRAKHGTRTCLSVIPVLIMARHLVDSSTAVLMSTSSPHFVSLQYRDPSWWQRLHIIKNVVLKAVAAPYEKGQRDFVTVASSITAQLFVYTLCSPTTGGKTLSTLKEYAHERFSEYDAGSEWETITELLIDQPYMT